MKSIIQRISSDEEFIGVHKLFDGRKTIEELKWLFTDPDNKKLYTAFVAKNKENEIIGVIGYQTAIFIQGDKELIGVIPFNWKVSPNHKGIHGMLLFKKLFNYGDFVYSIGGSKKAVSLLPLFKMNQVSEYYKSYKFISLFNFNSFRKSELKERINLIEYKNDSILFKENNRVFEKKLTNNYVDWLLKCPILDSYAFNIMEGKNDLGVCVFYINKFKNIKIGKIAYLPFLGDDINIWLAVIEKCLNFFRSKKCVLVSIMGHNKMNQLALKKSGFIGNKLIKRGIYFNGENPQIGPINFKSWHIQFSEGDQVYLGHNL